MIDDMLFPELAIPLHSKHVAIQLCPQLPAIWLSMLALFHAL